LASRGLTESILACLKDLVFVRDLDKNLFLMNYKDQFAQGLAGEEIKNIKCFHLFGDPEGRCGDDCPVDYCLGGGKDRHFTGKVSPLVIKGKPAGAIVVLSHSACPGHQSGGTAESAQGEKSPGDLPEAGEKYHPLLENLEDGFYEVDLAGSLKYCNGALAGIFGAPDKARLIGLNYRDYMESDQAESVYQVYSRVYSSGRPEKGFSLEIKGGDGARRTLEVSISLCSDSSGRQTGFMGVVRDITERCRTEDRLKYLSMHDVMTGLYNRTYFEEEMSRLKGGRLSPVTIICCDVDGLKMINDTFGHKKGDELLIQVAGILKGPFRSSDVVARVGGDEFAVILPKTDEETARRICERIHQAVGQYNLEGSDIPICLSLGSATGHISKDMSCDDLYRQADNDMYRQKLQNKAASSGAVVGSLVKALDDKDFLARGHAQRISLYAGRLGSAAGLSAREMTDLKLMAQLHDLGKVGVPEAILFKTGSLDEKEWSEMRQHCETGYRIARSTPELSSIADWILYHHEWWNGKGYPLGLKEEEIPLLCRVFSIADAYEVMTGDRPHHKAMSPEAACRELERCASSQFDPDLINLFIDIILQN